MPEVELQQIGPYTITELLRRSSTSDFYRVRHRKKEQVLQRLTVALSANDRKELFLTRGKQLRKLKSRNIINVTEVGFDGDFGYLVMEHTIGETLSQRTAPGEKLAPDIVKSYLSPAADALRYAHLNNTVHGNLHPGNLIYRTHDKTILLTDFALTLSDADLPLLHDEAFAIPYMAPEQLQGQPTPASDQYALAVMAYEWLCGHRPYDATERDLLLQQQQEISLPPPSHFNKSLSPAAESVLLHALAYDPEQRFPHAQEFSRQYLNALMGLPVNLAVPAPRKLTTPTTSSSKSQSAPTTPIIEQNGQSQQDQIHPTDITIPEPTQPAPAKKAIALPVIPVPSTPVLAPQDHNGHTPTAQLAGSTNSDEPVDEEDLVPVDFDFGNSRLSSVVSADLRQGGMLSQRLPGYEERLAQVEMASLVSRAITEHVPAIIEAATGTGKSLAYLLPIVRSGQVAIVSTANKALQEQLFYKDIPFIQKHIKPFKAALVKGVSNYVCIDRVETERMGLQHYMKNREFQRLYDMINDPDEGFNGDFETLGFPLPSDVRGRVATDSDLCAWSKCSYFMDCYVRQMREEASLAQIIVVNHTLLLLDAAIGGHLLPERSLIVLDEAHHLEEEATRSFTITITPGQIQTLLAQRMLKDHSLLSLQDDVLQKAQRTWLRLEQIANPGPKGRVNLELPLEEGLHLATALTDLADSLRRQRPKNLEERDGQLYDKLLKRAQNLAEDVRTVFSVAQAEKFVYYVERAESSTARAPLLQASAAPLDVTSWLKERLFDKCNVICTSATLATVTPDATRSKEKEPGFSYFRRRIGLAPEERNDVLESILPLTFDYESNALLYLPRHLPAPTFGAGSDDYMKAIAREMYKLVKISRGRAFLLFSSRRMLERAYELMAPHLPYPLLKQGDMTRLELTRRFREEEGAVLFGLKSFWEGVDIAGEALSLVVIDKLPFDPPDDPVHEARVARMKANGENWFGTYVLPQAVLRLKQGLGRLLRTREDRGVMAILDTRLHTKGYGKMVLGAMPPAQRSASLRDIERFFESNE